MSYEKEIIEVYCRTYNMFGPDKEGVKLAYNRLKRKGAESIDDIFPEPPLKRAISDKVPFQNPDRKNAYNSLNYDQEFRSRIQSAVDDLKDNGYLQQPSKLLSQINY